MNKEERQELEQQPEEEDLAWCWCLAPCCAPTANHPGITERGLWGAVRDVLGTRGGVLYVVAGVSSI